MERRMACFKTRAKLQALTRLTSKSWRQRERCHPRGRAQPRQPWSIWGAPLPPNEKERHETLCACQILDTAPDPRFDDITKLVRLFPSAMEPCCGPVSDVHTLRSVLLCAGEAVALLYLFCSCACSSCVAMEAWHLLLPACLVMSLSGSIQPC